MDAKLAGQFSQIAYDPPPSLPGGAPLPDSLIAADWYEVPSDVVDGVAGSGYQVGGYAGAYRIFVNDTSKQIVFAFQGTVSGKVLFNDIVNQGQQVVANVIPRANADLLQIEQQFPGYQITATGHSLGGAEAQTFAAINATSVDPISVYYFDSLPIAQSVLQPVAAAQGESVAELIANYQSKAIGSNPTVQIVGTYYAGEIAGDFYHTFPNTIYLDPNPTAIPSNVNETATISGTAAWLFPPFKAFKFIGSLFAFIGTKAVGHNIIVLNEAMAPFGVNVSTGRVDGSGVVQQPAPVGSPDLSGQTSGFDSSGAPTSASFNDGSVLTLNPDGSISAQGPNVTALLTFNQSANGTNSEVLVVTDSSTATTKTFTQSSDSSLSIVEDTAINNLPAEFSFSSNIDSNNNPSNPTQADLGENLDLAKAKLDSQSLDAKTEAQQLVAYALALTDAEVALTTELEGDNQTILQQNAGVVAAFLEEDLGQALANAKDDNTNPVQFADTSIFGNTKLDFSTYNSYENALAEADNNPQYASIRPLIDQTLAVVNQAGEDLVLRAVAGMPIDPFGDPMFDPNTAPTPSTEIKDEGTNTYALFLPYATGEGGQKVQIELSGDGASALKVQVGDQLVTPTDGTFYISVGQGATEATFTLLAEGDVQSQEQVTINATLVDANDQPTHQTHMDATLTVDAAPALPGGLRQVLGGGDPINFSTTGSTEYQYDDLGNVLTTNPGGFTQDTLYGGSQNVHIVGGAGRDSILAGSGNDLIEGNGSADVINGGSGNVQIFAGNQVDMAQAIENPAGVTGESFRGSWIDAGTGNSTVVGDGNNDVLTGNGNDLIIAGNGDNFILGHKDWLASSFDWSYTIQDGNYVFTPVAVLSTPNDSTSDTIYAGGGNNFVSTGNGDNFVNVGDGANTIYGGAGDNNILAGNGNNSIFADFASNLATNESQDYVEVGDGNNYVQVGQGSSTIIVGIGNNTIFSGAGDNDIEVNGGTGTDFIQAGDGDNTIVGADGIDSISAGDGNNEIDLGAGTDTVVLGAGANTVTGADGAYTVQTGTGANDIELGNGNDSINTGAGGNNPSVGKNTIFAGGGNDTIFAGDGANDIEVGSGTDEIVVGEGNNTIIGGDGNDTIFTGSGNNDIELGDGTNTVTLGTGGQDTIDAGAGSTLVHGQGSALVDVADGGTAAAPLSVTVDGTGNDTIYGGNGVEVLQGGRGSNSFIAGSGQSTLIGGSGTNTYELDVGFGAAQINPASPSDKVIFGTGISANQLTVTTTFTGGNPALLITDTNGDALTIQGGLGDSLDNFTFTDAGNTLDLQQLVTQAQRGASQPVYLSQVESQYLAQATGKIIQGLQQEGGVQQADGSWYVPPFDSGFQNGEVGTSTTTTTWSYTDIHGNPQSQTFTSASGESWSETFGGNLGATDSSTSLIQGTVATSDPVVNAADTSGVSVGYAQVPVTWTIDPNSLTPTFSSFQANGYAYTDGTFGFQNEPGAIAATVVTTSVGSSYDAVARPTLSRGAVVLQSGSPITQGEGSLPSTLVVPIDHLQNTVNLQQINVGPSDPTINAGSNTVVNAGSADNVINGGGFVSTDSGNDTVINADVVYAGSGDNTITGANTVYEGSGDNVISHSSVIFGGTGSNSIERADTIYGGVGSDLIDGSDTVYVGAGDDTVSSSNTVVAGSGNDFLVFDGDVTAGSGNDAIIGYSFENTISIDPATVGDVLIGGITDPTLESAISNAFSLNAQSDVPFSSTLSGVGVGSLYDQNQVYASAVSFGPGVSSSDLEFSTSLVIGAQVGIPIDPQNTYTTLNMGWGTGQEVQIVLPRADDAIGPGVNEFEFADGTTLTLAQMEALATAQLGTLEPSSFLFNLNDGDVTLTDLNGLSNVQFGPSINPSDVTVSRDGVDLLLTDAANDQLRIANWYANPAAVPTISVNFADGTSLSAATLTAEGLVVQGADNVNLTALNGFSNTLIAGAGNISLSAGDGNDTLVAGSGNDTLVGGAGTDTYVINLTNGVTDHVVDGSGVANTIQFGSGITPSMVSLQENGGSLDVSVGQGFQTFVDGALLEIGQSGETISVDNFNPLNGPQPGGSGDIELSFADGTVWDANQLNAHLSPYFFGLGALGLAPQQLVISDPSSIPNIEFYNSNNPQLTVERDGTDLVLTDAYQDQLRFEDWYDPSRGAPSVQVTSDFGTVWDGATLSTLGLIQTDSAGWSELTALDNFDNYLIGTGGVDTLIGGTGNDTLVGGSSNDLLQAGAGNDEINDNFLSPAFIAGGQGNDLILSGNRLSVIAFNRGDGQDTVEAALDFFDNAVALGGTLSLGGGITAQDLTLVRDNSDLILDAGHGDSIRLANWYGLNSQYWSQVGLQIVSSSGAQLFNLAAAVSEFDSLAAQNSALTQWTPGITWSQFATESSTDSAVGGALAYQYGTAGTTSALDASTVQSILTDPTFGLLQPIAVTKSIFQFSLGGGEQVITDPLSVSAVRVVGIDSSEISVSRDNADLVLSDVDDGTDSLRVKNWYATSNAAAQINMVFPVQGELVQDDTTGGSALYAINGSINILENTSDAPAADDALYAGTRDDSLYGGFASDLLEGGSGNNQLGDGELAPDFIAAGTGNSLIDASDSSDIIAYNADGGYTTVQNWNGTVFGGGTLSLGGGITAQDLTFIKDQNDLLIETGANGSIRVSNWYDTDPQSRPTVDLQIISRTSVQSFDFNAALAEFDVLQAEDPTLTTWHPGAALLSYESGTSTTAAIGGVLAYQYAVTGTTKGVDLATIQGVLTDPNFGTAPQSMGPLQPANEFAYSAGSGLQTLGDIPGINTVTFGPGITSDMITLGLGSLLLRIGNSGDELELTDFDPSNALGPHNIEHFIFSDGTNISYEQLLARGFDIYGTSGDETLSGTNLDNRIHAGTGNDLLIGTGAHDSLYGGVGNDTLQAGAGVDQLVGGSGNDTLIAGTGGDRLLGGSGRNTFVLNLGDGLDSIDDSADAQSSQPGTDVIEFGTGLTATDVVFAQQGADVSVTYGSQGDSAVIKNFTLGGASGAVPISSYQFADGSSIAYSDDAQGNYTFTYMDASGHQVGDQWGHADGSHGSDRTLPDGSTLTKTVNADGSSTTSTYTASTGVYGYDVVNADGSSIDYATTYDAGGGYQQSWTASNGTSGENDKADDGSTLTKTVNADGSSTTSTYTASTGVYGYDVVNADGSYIDYLTSYGTGSAYQQGWTRSDGTAGSTAVDASGVQIGDSSLTAAGLQTVDAGGNQLLIGATSADTLGGGTGGELLIGEAGSDVITTGTGNNVIAFDAGDGQDTVDANAGQGNTISLGGTLSYADLAFQENGNDLILDVGANDAITLKDWYGSPGDQNIVTLQVVAAAMSDYAPGSGNVLSNAKVETFDFQRLVSEFNQAQAANPGMNAWSLTSALLDAHLAGSNTAALGGDLAYDYGLNGNLTGFGVAAAESTLSNSQFGAAPQSISPSSAGTEVARLK